MRFERGDIFHSTGFPFIDHGKFFVVIGQDGDNIIGAFFVNSNIRNFLLSKPKLLNLQFGMSCHDYDFLTHNSYIDCSQIIRIDKKDLESDIKSGIATRKGKMLADDISHILQTVIDSDVFSESERRFFK